MSGYRLATGGRIDRGVTLPFTWDGRSYQGHAGDTLASALLANGVRLVGRSFKYHRPRGIVTAGPEEPCALVTLGAAARRDPNTPAPTIELFAGLQAESQNRWPSLKFDVMAVNGLFASIMPAGFYYKTFMWPAAFWERVYEPMIRRAAGLGRAAQAPDPDHYEHEHSHCDVLVVGAGPAGLSAARAAADAGARVILVEQDFELGGGLLVEPGLEAWRRAAVAALDGRARVLARTTAIGAYDHGVFAAVERIGDHLLKPDAHRPRQRLHVIRARHAVLATGAVERLVAFPDNDRPGVMLASAARAFANRWGVAVGERVALFTNNDEAYATVTDLAAAGVEIAAIVDVRAESHAATVALKAGLPVRLGHEVCGVSTSHGGVHGIHVRRIGSARSEYVSAGALCVSGGYSPLVQLASQARTPLAWNDAIAAFVPGAEGGPVRSAGAARGIFGVREAAADGEAAGRAATAALRLKSAAAVPLPDTAVPTHTPLAPLWSVDAPGKAFVDLQNDVTADDLRLAHREGYSHIEHAKRYTTFAMATDQGKIGSLVGSAVLAQARGEAIAAVGLPRFRPYTTPVAWGALAGADVGAHFKPERLLPLHDWHKRSGAVFVKIGLWLRPLVYSPSGDTSWEPVLAEARAVRHSVGMTDVSSLGKIDVQGPDAARFLDRIYANTASTIAVGKSRYGLMLREDGMLFDDGTIARLSPDHFLITATTQKSADVLEHMEWHLQTVWSDLDVTLTNVADHWAQFAVAGPNARRVLEAVVTGLDLSNKAFPFMAVADARIADVPGRVFRISFSGEQAYEVAVPAGHAEHVWTAILAAGKPHGIVPYGLDALNVLRIEKGHVTGGEINGQTTPHDLGLGGMLKKSGDFIGRTLGRRAGLREEGRLQLVGLAPTDVAHRLRGGAHLVSLAGTGPSRGFVTATCMAAEGKGWIALALLAGGRARHGERLIAASPVYGEAVEVIVTTPHHVDRENARVRT
jgi:methylglutamate dehydrogenase subunit C